ncbi:hypothetical protein [Agarilytica rhodophyticola]|uniref:hypothetical protein n=1 Tax=Agarilytica rhodophyticola TaxID=1737490 RepID=UPI000B345370|nr:hypothetical protein [Agarilytica rhodophyticola]
MSRCRGYSIKKSSKLEHQKKYSFDQARKQLVFIGNDVMAYIEKNYRADTLNHTYLVYFLGRAFGAYVVMAQRGTFKDYILGSPSLKGDIPSLTALATQVKPNIFIRVLKDSKDPSLSLCYIVVEDNHRKAFSLR